MCQNFIPFFFSFLFKADYYSIVNICHILFIQPLMGTWIASTFVAIVKTDVMHTDIQAALQLACFQFFGVYIPKSRIGRLYGNSIFNF